MIEYKDGDIFASDCEAWCNPVNCVGVMGAGLAREFRQRFPAMFEAYTDHCDRDLLSLGGVFSWQNESPPPLVIICVATKNHFRDRSTQQGVLRCLENISSECHRLGITSVAIPALGCGLGGLPWDVFREAVRDVESAFNGVRVTVYRPCA